MHICFAIRASCGVLATAHVHYNRRMHICFALQPRCGGVLDSDTAGVAGRRTGCGARLYRLYRLTGPLTAVTAPGSAPGRVWRPTSRGSARGRGWPQGLSQSWNHAPAGRARGAAVGVDVREGAVTVVGGNESRREHDQGIAPWVCVVLWIA